MDINIPIEINMHKVTMSKSDWGKLVDALAQLHKIKEAAKDIVPHIGSWETIIQQCVNILDEQGGDTLWHTHELESIHRDGNALKNALED